MCYAPNWALLQRLFRTTSCLCNPLHRADVTFGICRWREVAIVLLPNAALCKQALAVADSLKGPEGVPLVATSHLSSSSPPRPHQQLDIAVVTSGELPPLTNTRAASMPACRRNTSLLYATSVVTRVVLQGYRALEDIVHRSLQGPISEPHIS